MCSRGFEKVSHKDPSIRLWKSSPGRLIGTCHLTGTVALLARARARQFSSHSSRAEKLYGATLIKGSQINLKGGGARRGTRVKRILSAKEVKDGSGKFVLLASSLYKLQ